MLTFSLNLCILGANQISRLSFSCEDVFLSSEVELLRPEGQNRAQPHDKYRRCEIFSKIIFPLKFPYFGYGLLKTFQSTSVLFKVFNFASLKI